jgi:hypothetical protein
MILTLIALTLLLIGAAALMRTVDSSSILVGNLAFRRDLTNRAETAIADARNRLVSGALSTEPARIVDLPAQHYSATKLPVGSNGVPSVLLSESDYASKYTAPTTSSDGIILRWVIDRQCASGTGAYQDSACEYVAATGADTGGAKSPGGPPVAGTTRPVYRISVRVTGPRGTEAYYQTTYAD